MNGFWQEEQDGGDLRLTTEANSIGANLSPMRDQKEPLELASIAPPMQRRELASVSFTYHVYQFICLRSRLWRRTPLRRQSVMTKAVRLTIEANPITEVIYVNEGGVRLTTGGRLKTTKAAYV